MSLMIEKYNLLTKNPIIEIIIPSILAIYSPFECGFMLAIFMANADGENMYVKSIKLFDTDCYDYCLYKIHVKYD